MKRSLRLVIGVGVVAVLVAVLLVLQNREPVADDTLSATFDSSGRETFLQVDRDAVRRVTVENPDGEIVLLPGEAEDTGAASQFSVLYPFDVEFVQRDVNRVVQSATRLTSRRIFEDVVEELADFGLDDPQATVTVETGDSTRVISIGAQTPARDAYYVQVDGDDRVFSLASSVIAPFFRTIDSLRVRVIPPIATETLQRVAIDTLDGEQIRIRRKLETEVDPEIGFSSLLTVAPYNRPFQTGTTWLEETVLASYAEAQIGRFVDDDPAADLSPYGLSQPLARIALEDEQTSVEILIGEQAGGGRYAKFSDQPSVFVISGIGPIIRSDPYDAISPFALILGIDLIDRFVVQTPEAEFTGSIERTEVEGEEDPEEAFFLNGQPISEDVFRDLYQWIIGLQLDAEGGTVTEGTPVATITYYFSDGSRPRSVSFYPQSENFVSVVRGGETEFIMARSKISRMINAFEEAAAEL